MESLEEYSSLELKSNFFNQRIINTKEELSELMNEFSNSKKDENNRMKIFRGVNESKYKLYNSLQRKWVNDKIYSKFKKNLDNIDAYYNFICSFLYKLRTNDESLITRYFNNLGIKNITDIGLLSYLQHHDAPTPFLDWTYNFFNALYFGNTKLNRENKNEIDNYFSIYFIDRNLNPLELKDFSWDKYVNEANLFGKKKQNPEINYSKSEDAIMNYKIEVFFNKSIALFTFNENINNENYFLYTTLNIISQEGLFIYNRELEKPLEYHFQDREEIPHDEKEYINFDNYSLQKIKCFDIHKDLSKEIKLILDKKGINCKKLFPKDKNLALNAYESAFNEI